MARNSESGLTFSDLSRDESQKSLITVPAGFLMTAIYAVQLVDFVG